MLVVPPDPLIPVLILTLLKSLRKKEKMVLSSFVFGEGGFYFCVFYLLSVKAFFFFLSFFVFLEPAPTAYGSSQARG